MRIRRQSRPLLLSSSKPLVLDKLSERPNMIDFTPVGQAEAFSNLPMPHLVPLFRYGVLCEQLHRTTTSPSSLSQRLTLRVSKRGIYCPLLLN